MTALLQLSSDNPVLGELLGLSTITLATSGKDGQPHAAPVYFVALGGSGQDPFRAYFFSEDTSLHARHLAENPQAAVALYPECWSWTEIRGLQMRGEARRVQGGTDWENAWAAYLAKFPFVSELKEAIARNALYVFIPRWIRLIDNRRGFGYKQEWGTT